MKTIEVVRKKEVEKMAKLLLLDVVNDEFNEIEIAEGDISKYHDYLNCRCFDIACRRIGGTYFDIFCDDEGLFKEGNPVSAINSNTEVMLVGNLIFANHDAEGNTTSLSDEDINIIKSNTAKVFRRKHNTADGTDEIFPYTVVVCEY